MPIRIIFPTEKASVTTSSLHQWDYGQILEIESADLLPIVEVHFACAGMSEAIVRPCSVNNGIATVPIPDICLEQSGTIFAWVFEINGTEGMTRKTISIPVVGRLKPAPGDDIPTEVYNRYTELITELNEAIKALTAGNVTVAQATNANYAAEAGHANSASSSDLATRALNADNASQANRALSANHADELYIYDDSPPDMGISRVGLYLVFWKTTQDEIVSDLIFIHNLSRAVRSASANVSYDGTSRRISVTGETILGVFPIGQYDRALG